MFTISRSAGTHSSQNNLTSLIHSGYITVAIPKFLLRFCAHLTLKIWHRQKNIPYTQILMFPVTVSSWPDVM